jgi:6-phosphogluconate dehydrogenase
MVAVMGRTIAINMGGIGFRILVINPTIMRTMVGEIRIVGSYATDGFSTRTRTQN